MDITTIVLLVFNAIMILCIVMGFLWGLKRGLKKSVTRLAFIVGCLLVAFFVAMPVTNALLNMDISGIVSYTDDNGNTLKSINDILTNAICSISPEIEEAYAHSESLRALIDSLPKMILQSFVFLILFWILKVITWPIFAIIAKIVWGEKKKSKKEKAQEEQENRTIQGGKVIENGNVTPPEPKPQKKMRWWGALVGTIQGFTIAFCTMIPFAGISSIFSSLDKQSNNVSASAEQSDTDDMKPLGDMLKENLGDDIFDALTAYEKSFMGVFCGISGVDDLAFDLQTSARVGKNTTNLRKEIKAFAGAYSEIQKLQSFDLATLDFDTLQKVFDCLFSSPALMNIADDLIPYYVDKFLEDPNTNIDKNLRAFLVLYLDSYGTPKMAELKNDLESVINAMKIIQEKDIFSLNEISLKNLIDLLESDEQNNPVKEIFTALTGSTTTQKVLQTAVNYALDMLSEELTSANGSEIKVAHAQFQNIDWSEIQNEVPTIINNLIDLFRQYDIDGNTQNKIDNVDIVKIGATLDVLTCSTLLNEAYKNALTALNQVEKYAKYINFNSLKANLNFTQEFTHIQNIVDAMIEVDALCFVLDNSIKVDEFLIRLSGKVDAQNTCIDVVVDNLVACTILKSSAPRSLNTLYTETLLPKLKPNVLGISPIDETNIDWNVEKQVLKTILNFTSTYSNYVVNSLSAETILKNVDLSKFGESLDSMKQSDLLYPLYKALIDYAKVEKSIGEFIDLDSISLDTNWKEELEKLKLTFDEVKSSGLIDVLFVADGLNQALDIIKSDKTIIENIVDNAFDSRIVQASVENLVNKLQEFVGKSLNVTIQDTTVDVDNFKQNLENKKTEFSNVIYNLAIVASPITKDNFDLDVFADNLTDFANAFDSLQKSAEFKNTYNAVLQFLIDDEGINKVVDFSVVGENFNYIEEFETIGEIIDTLKQNNAWTPLVEGTQSVDQVVDSLDADTKSQVVELILQSKLFKGYAVQALNEMIDEFNGYLGSSVAHIPEETDLSSQSENIALVTKKLLELTDGGMTTVVLNQIDLVKTGELLTALKENKFTLNGALSGIYDAFVDYMVDDADYGYIIKDACNSFGSATAKENSLVDWNKICDAFNDLLALEDDLDDMANLTSENISSVLNSIGTNQNTLVVRITKTFLKDEKTGAQQTAIDNFDFSDTEFNSQAIDIVYGLKDLGLNSTISNTDLNNILDALKTTLQDLSELNRTKLDNLIAFVDAVTNSSYAEMIEGTNFAQEANLIDKFKALLNHTGDFTIELLTNSITAFNDSNLILNELYKNNVVICNVKDTNILNSLKKSLANGIPASAITDDAVYQALNEIIANTVDAEKQVKVKSLLNLD